MNAKEKTRFSALMLFQFRTEKNGISNQRRVCEERIIVIQASSALEALRLVRQKGIDEEFSYYDNDIEVFFEFIGVMELIELGTFLDEDEVWYHFIEKLRPMENKDKILPSESQLDAFQNKLHRKHGRLGVPGKR